MGWQKRGKVREEECLDSVEKEERGMEACMGIMGTEEERNRLERVKS